MALLLEPLFQVAHPPVCFYVFTLVRSYYIHDTNPVDETPLFVKIWYFEFERCLGSRLCSNGLS